MQIIHTIDALRSAVRSWRRENPEDSVGFVPTMGFLHRGHASLLDTARQGNGLVILSIFVNPLQFGPNEDLERYPRDEQRDLAVAEASGTDIVFFPQAGEMYPQPTRTLVQVSEVTERLCGASRPGHFDGVATVVTKLFNIVQPDRAYFGLKDAQQLAVIEQMVMDLNQLVAIVPCPIVREEDGLALSSRNVYLSAAERQEALVLSRTLDEVEQRLNESPVAEVNPAELREFVISRIQAAPLADIDYVEILSYPQLQPLDTLEGTSRLIVALAVRFGATRLIDNRIFDIMHS